MTPIYKLHKKSQNTLHFNFRYSFGIVLTIKHFIINKIVFTEIISCKWYTNKKIN